VVNAYGVVIGPVPKSLEMYLPNFVKLMDLRKVLHQSKQNRSPQKQTDVMRPTATKKNIVHRRKQWMQHLHQQPKMSRVRSKHIGKIHYHMIRV
jgi:hypothetical protein